VATGLPTPNNRLLADRDNTVGSPRVAALYRFTDSVSAWGAWSKGFRAPTLNELYRQFRVGAILTLANDQLGPERLTGGEAGVNVAVSRNTTVRTTWFDNRVKNPVSNVTIALNTQQRQNLGRTRIWGVQSDVEYRLGARWRNSLRIQRSSESSWRRYRSIAGRRRHHTRTGWPLWVSGRSSSAVSSTTIKTCASCRLKPIPACPAMRSWM